MATEEPAPAEAEPTPPGQDADRAEPPPKTGPLDAGEREAFEARRKATVADLDELIGDLARRGHYDCCTKSPCKMCALRTGGCRCGEGLRKGLPVCSECAYLWQQGQGDEPGVEVEDVRSFLEAAREARHHAAGHPAVCDCANLAPEQRMGVEAVEGAKADGADAH